MPALRSHPPRRRRHNLRRPALRLPLPARLRLPPRARPPLLRLRLPGAASEMFMIFKRSGEPTQFRFMPGCLVFSIVASIVLTILLNLLIRVF